ncbi:MAG: class I SAM-dependent methyltransferase [Chlorobi bacterium]|nr:class I SAM-dependent methyltransferase [Chlorobiota bacterium]
MYKSIRSKFKQFVEINFWRYKKIKEGELTNWHYKQFYTDYFGLEESFYNNKIILDIGCGPRGSLEWADMSKERYGLDPLADKYLRMGAHKHKMTYVKAYSESIPFNDSFFDVICSFNSLDHVEDIGKTILEIRRTLKPGGVFLLIVDVHAYPTPTEPQSIKWDFCDTYFPDYKLLIENKYKTKELGKIYANARARIPADKNDKSGLLVCMLEK